MASAEEIATKGQRSRQSSAPARQSDASMHPRRWLLLSGLWLIYFGFGVITVGMAPMVERIVQDLAIDRTRMGLIFGAWPFVYILTALPCGLILDRVPARWTLFAAATIIGASGVARGLAEDGLTLFLAVAAFGIGGPLISVGTPTLVAQWFNTTERGLAIGAVLTAPALGNAASYALTNTVFLPMMDDSWRMVMCAQGLFAFATGIVWLLIARLGNDVDPLKAPTVEAPLRPASMLALLSDGSVVAILILGLLIFAVNHGAGNWLPAILISQGFEPNIAGVWATVPVVVGIVASMVIPRMAYPGRRVRVMILLALSITLAMLLLLAGSAPILAASMLLLGLARGAMMAIALLMLMDLPAVPRGRVGLAGGMFFITAEIGGVSGSAAIGLLWDLSGGVQTPVLALAAVGVTMTALLNGLIRQTAGGTQAAIAEPTIE